MEQEFEVTIHARTEIVQIIGEEESCEQVRQVIQALLVLVNRGMTIGTPDVVTAITMVRNGELDKFIALYEEEIIKDSYGKPIRVKTLGQKIYGIIADVGRLSPGAPSLGVAMASDITLVAVRPGVENYGHLRERLSWIVAETSRRSERVRLGVLLIAPWKARHEADDLTRLLRGSGLEVPVVGVLAFDQSAADSLAGRRARPLGRTLLVRSARTVATALAGAVIKGGAA